jgi:hypothetical protein
MRTGTEATFSTSVLNLLNLVQKNQFSGSTSEYVVRSSYAYFTSHLEKNYENQIFPPSKTMQLHSYITDFRLKYREPLAVFLGKDKGVCEKFPSHGM